MTDSAIATVHHTKTCGTTRGIHDVDLTVNTDEISGFLGPNGAGTPTTLRTPLGFGEPVTAALNVFPITMAAGGQALLRVIAVTRAALAIPAFQRRDIYT